MRDVVVGHSSCGVVYAPMHSFSIDVVFAWCRIDRSDDGDHLWRQKMACCPMFAVSLFTREFDVSCLQSSVLPLRGHRWSCCFSVEVRCVNGRVRFECCDCIPFRMVLRDAETVACSLCVRVRAFFCEQ